MADHESMPGSATAMTCPKCGGIIEVRAINPALIACPQCGYHPYGDTPAAVEQDMATLPKIDPTVSQGVQGANTRYPQEQPPSGPTRPDRDPHGSSPRENGPIAPETPKSEGGQVEKPPKN